jgi:hypothetical protein
MNGAGPKLAGLAPDDTLLTSLLQVCREINDLDSTRRELLAKAILLPAGAADEEDFLTALERLRGGKNALVLPFGKATARKLVASVNVLGSAPAESVHWEQVQEVVTWRIAARTCLASWNSVAGEFGIELQTGNLDSAFKKVSVLQSQIIDPHTLALEHNENLTEEIERVFKNRTCNPLANLGLTLWMRAATFG